MLEPQAKSNLDELLEQICEGSWNADLAARLDKLLAGHPEAQRYYLEQMELVSSLRWYAANEQTRQAISQLRAAGIAPDGRPPAELQPARTRLPAGRARMWATLAASLLVACGIAGWLALRQADIPQLAVPQPAPEPQPIAVVPPPDKERPPEGPAAVVLGRVLLARDVRSSDARPAPREGDAVHAGTLRWEQGLVRLELDAGVLLTLEGPAEIELVDLMHARLPRGRLTVYVPPRAVGYTVAAGDLSVTDLGADFGLERDAKGAVRLAVFRGEVEATLDSRYLGMTERMRLTRSDGLAVDREGSVTSSILGDDSRFAALKPSLDRHVPHVVNGSFEHPRTDDRATAAAVGWELMAHPLANADRMDIQAGVIRAGHPALATPGSVPPASEGQQWAYLDARTFADGRTTYTSMHQSVGLIVAGARYRLRATIARPLEGPAASYTIGVYAGASATGPQTPLKQWTDPAVPAAQKSVRLDLTYESPDHTPYRDDELFLVIQAVPAAKAGLRQVLVDDVQLEIIPPAESLPVPVPEAVP
jgi:hypothetical protein